MDTVTTKPTCERYVWVRGEDRRCGQSVGVTTWTDSAGQTHTACVRHLEGVKRRYPELLVEALPNRGRLGLSTPWARGLFGPNDRIAVENELPEGWTLGVSVSAMRSWVILWLIDPDKVERARWPRHPLKDAIGGATKLAKLAQTMAGEGVLA